MNSDFRLKVDFYQHPKLQKLRRRLGGDAAYGWVCLLGYTAANRPDGRYDGMDAEDMALAAQYPGDGEQFVNAMVELRLLDRVDGELVVHGWAEWNEWAAGAKDRSELARQGGRSRWAGVPAEQRAEHMRRLRTAGSSRPADEPTTSSARETDELPTSTSSSTTSSPTNSSLLSSLPSRDLARKEIPLEKKDLEHNESGGAVAPAAHVLFPESKPKPKPAQRGTRLDETFKLTPERERFALGVGVTDPKVAFRKFQNHWMNVTGSKSLKLDWNRTWENWCYGELERQPAKVLRMPNAPVAVGNQAAYRPASEVLREQYTEDELRQIQERRRKQG